ncbi:hypothetical protein C8Q77DRAFT_1092943 [Trametes polyzona]|nr:hypothetical protein C8Q77DRAFT_1092943 [Trametes polyzona]
MPPSLRTHRHRHAELSHLTLVLHRALPSPTSESRRPRTSLPSLAVASCHYLPNTPTHVKPSMPDLEISEKLKAEILSHYEERLAPLDIPQDRLEELISICAGIRRAGFSMNSPIPDYTFLHFGFLLTPPEILGIMHERFHSQWQKILTEEVYLNDRLDAIHGPVTAKSFTPRFLLRETVTGSQQECVFSLFRMKGFTNTRFVPEVYEDAINIFKEFTQQREPMCYFDDDQYNPRNFNYQPFDADQVLTPKLARFVAEVRGLSHE